MKFSAVNFCIWQRVLLRSLSRLPSAKFLVEAMRLTALNKSASTDQWPLGQVATPIAAAITVPRRRRRGAMSGVPRGCTRFVRRIQ
jgi:hypothetical protein